MKTLLSGNYAVAQFEVPSERGSRSLRLHIYRKNEQQWMYESYIPLKMHTSSPVQISAFSLLGNKALVTAETESGVEMFEYIHASGGEWKQTAAARRFKPGYENQVQRMQKWSKHSLYKLLAYMRIPAPVLAGV